MGGIEVGEATLSMTEELSLKKKRLQISGDPVLRFGFVKLGKRFSIARRASLEEVRMRTGEWEW